MSHLAREYGVASQRLKDLCVQAKIPTPPAGHWTRVAAGKSVIRPPLPEAARDASIVIIAPSPSCNKTSSQPARVEADGRKAKSATKSIPGPKQKSSAKSAPYLSVPTQLRNPHRIIAAWLEEHQRSRENARRSTLPGLAPTPFTSVDRRRQRILDTLFKAIEKAGGKAIEEDRKKLAIELEGEAIPIQLREKNRQIRRSLTEDEKRWSWNAGKDWKLELQPTGKLVFEIKRYLPRDFRQDWLETDEVTLEACLPEIFNTLTRAAPLLALETQKRRERERLARIAEHERYLAEQARKRDDNQWQRFLEVADNWQRHERARHFLQALKQLDLDPDIMIGERSLGEWLVWVERRLTTGNPLNQGIDTLFADIEKVTNYTYSQQHKHW
ncbi:hypothetical protein [Halomonas lysinitropha]